jgi:hypothetical protein
MLIVCVRCAFTVNILTAAVAAAVRPNKSLSKSMPKPTPFSFLPSFQYSLCVIDHRLRGAAAKKKKQIG